MLPAMIPASSRAAWGSIQASIIRLLRHDFKGLRCIRPPTSAGSTGTTPAEGRPPRCEGVPGWSPGPFTECAQIAHNAATHRRGYCKDGILSRGGGHMKRTTIAFIALVAAALILATAAVINGTAQADTLTGTSERDSIHARGGADTASGRGGRDFVWGESGDDELSRKPRPRPYLGRPRKRHDQRWERSRHPVGGRLGQRHRERWRRKRPHHRRPRRRHDHVRRRHGHVTADAGDTVAIDCEETISPAP